MCDPVPFPAKYTKATIPQKLQLDIKDTDIALPHSQKDTLDKNQQMKTHSGEKLPFSTEAAALHP